MPRPGHRRARIAFSDTAAKQLEELTDEADLHGLDRALVAISVDPEIGEPIPADGPRPELRQYTDPFEQVRCIYHLSAMRTVVIVAFFEV